MKKNKLPFLLLILLVSIQTTFAKTPAVIKGNIKNAQVYSYIYLYRILGAETIKIDSNKLNNGLFEFKTKENMLRGFYKIGVDDKSSFTFVFDNTSLTINGDLLLNQINIENSKENELYSQYLSLNEWHSKEFKKLDTQAQSFMEFRYSDPQRFNLEIGRLQKQLDTINQLLRDRLKQIAEGNKGSFMGKVALMFVNYDTTSQANFFKKEEFLDEEYSRGDMLSNKIYIFMQRYYQQGDLKIASYQILSKFEKINANKEIAYGSLIRGIYQQDMDYARSLAEQYYRDFPESPFAKYFMNAIPKGMPKVGEIPPNITEKDPSGKSISLYDLRGKVVLIDFWASWCGPCRKENPNVVMAYNKYKEKGFTVFSVSLDTKKDAWVAAIQKDGLIWENHVSDLNGWNSELAKLYGVRGIPAAFLIDKTGKIVATNLRGAELDMTLDKIFNE